MSVLPHVTIAGTRVTIAITFEKNRTRQTSRKPAVPHPFHCTSAASRNDERNGASSAAKTTNTATRRNVSNRTGRWMNNRTPAAPSSASAQLLTNQDRTIGSGTPLPSSTARWAGSAASNSQYHDRTGANSSAPRRMAFGGQSVETGCDAGVSANPTRAPA